jgi:riboflavin kinase/FMN adenylyltransferase
MSLEIIEWPAASAVESAMTIGVFDGVHLGHLELIKTIVRRGPNPTVVTFRENPKKLVSPKTYHGDLFSLKQKLKAFENLGIGRVILIDFSEEFSKLKGQEFLSLLEEQGKAVFLAIGSDFRCGCRQDTGPEAILAVNERKGIPTEIVPPVRCGAGLVSSSRIRSAILSGDMKEAAVLSGRNIELDLSDLEPVSRDGKKVYDPGRVHRIVPGPGTYPVLMYPGGSDGLAITENGKVFLPGEAERLEFCP